jgi:hypothetical protein
VVVVAQVHLPFQDSTHQAQGYQEAVTNLLKLGVFM